MRVAIVGASGALGGEVLAALDETRLPIDALVPIATERSLGNDVEFRGESIPIETELAKLRGVDLAFLCAPPAATLEAVRAALRAEVPAIDCSGALAANPDVPLVSELGVATSPALDVPLVALPTGAALACARVLAPLGRALGLRRVIATLLESASGAGRAGVLALSEETIALLSQQESPDPAALGHPVAFDVLPWIGEIDDAGVSAAEHALAAVLARALGPEVGIALTALRIPVFCGEGISLAAEFAEDVSLARIIELLAKVDGLDLGLPAPTTRAAAGSDDVFVGRVRRDPSCERGALLWLAADGLALTATHAVRVAEARFRRV
jgi:aspartate-semialdehyde dehydrogenase